MLSISTKRLLRNVSIKKTKRNFNTSYNKKNILRQRQCWSPAMPFIQTSLCSHVNENPWKITSLWLNTSNNINQDDGHIMEINSALYISTLSDKMTKRIQKMKDRHDEILDLLIKPNAPTTDLGKELSQLAPVSSLYDKLEEMKEEHKAIHEMLDDLSQIHTNKGKNDEDDDMRKECEEEIKRIESIIRFIESKLVDAVIPTEDDDYNADAILEIRAGTGGDEAALFANELLTTYEKTSKAKGYTCEILHLSKTELGGIREAAISISSSSYASSHFQSHDMSQLDLEMKEENEKDSNSHMLDGLSPYGYFKYESGVHRVQRVPVNDVRIHTSTASVAVFPNSRNQNHKHDNDLFPQSDLKIETFRASGAGGQHVNTTESAVRITHLPTGITAAIQDERSQHKNKAKAMKLITARVLNAQKEQEAKEKGELRSTLIGGGGRSERIRTYNFPQDRVTDHRCKHSEYGIPKLLEGGGGTNASGSDDESGLVSCFLPLMKRMYRDEVLREMEEDVESDEDIPSKKK